MDRVACSGEPLNSDDSEAFTPGSTLIPCTNPVTDAGRDRMSPASACCTHGDATDGDAVSRRPPGCVASPLGTRTSTTARCWAPAPRTGCLRLAGCADDFQNTCDSSPGVSGAAPVPVSMDERRGCRRWPVGEAPTTRGRSTPLLGRVCTAVSLRNAWTTECDGDLCRCDLFVARLPPLVATVNRVCRTLSLAVAAATKHASPSNASCCEARVLDTLESSPLISCACTR